MGSIPPRSTIQARTSRSAIPATEQIVVGAHVNNRIQVGCVLPEDNLIAMGAVDDEMAGRPFQDAEPEACKRRVLQKLCEGRAGGLLTMR